MTARLDEHRTSQAEALLQLGRSSSNPASGGVYVRSGANGNRAAGPKTWQWASHAPGGGVKATGGCGSGCGGAIVRSSPPFSPSPPISEHTSWRVGRDVNVSELPTTYRPHDEQHVVPDVPSSWADDVDELLGVGVLDVSLPSGPVGAGQPGLGLLGIAADRVADSSRLQTGLAQASLRRPPNLAEPPTGCRFHPRCPLAIEKCKTDVPPLEVVGLDHRVACWRSADVGPLGRIGFEEVA